MSESKITDNIPSNEEVVDDITKNLETQLTVNSAVEEKTESTAKVIDNERNSGIPEDFEDSDKESAKEELTDDYVDEEKLKDLELTLTEEQLYLRYNESLELKERGNNEFIATKYLESIITYTEALKLCPLKYKSNRSIFYSNRAASKARLDRKESAIDDCSRAIELNDKYVKAYLKRAKLYEEMEKLDESLEDYKKILTLDPTNKDALQAQYRLPPLIAERNEKMKTEMLGKLKDLGNMFLKPFGLSTDNFQLNQDPSSGGYSVNFTQNAKR